MMRKQPLPRRIGLFGGFGWGNSGNEGSLQAMLDFLRCLRPDTELLCICPEPDRVRKDHGIRAIEFRVSDPVGFARRLDRLLFGTPQRLANWVFALRLMHRLDLMIIPGTGILDDFGSEPWFLPYTLLRWCLSARLCRTEIWFVSVGAGPIHHPTSRRFMKWAAGMAAYRSYRDTISKAFVESIGLDTSLDRVYPDLAFKLPDPDRSVRRPFEGAVVTVGVGIMNYGGWFRYRSEIFGKYIQKMVGFIIWLLDHEYRVRILTGDSVDQPAVDSLVEALTAGGRTVAPEQFAAEPTPTLHALMREIALTDIVVATRFHNVVCALKLGRPTISIGYAAKNDALLADVGLADFCQHIEQLDVGLLIEQFCTLVADRHRHEQRVTDSIGLYQRRLADQEAHLASRLAQFGGRHAGHGDGLDRGRIHPG